MEGINEAPPVDPGEEKGGRIRHYVAAVHDALGLLDGTEASAVSLLSGVPIDRIGDYGAMPHADVAREDGKR